MMVMLFLCVVTLFSSEPVLAQQQDTQVKLIKQFQADYPWFPWFTKRYPVAFKEIVNDYQKKKYPSFRAYAIYRTAFGTILKDFPNYLKNASDKDIHQYTDLMVSILKTYPQLGGYFLCYNQGLAVAHKIPADKLNQMVSVMKRIIDNASHAKKVIPTQKEITPILKPIITKLNHQYDSHSVIAYAVYIMTLKEYLLASMSMHTKLNESELNSIINQPLLVKLKKAGALKLYLSCSQLEKRRDKRVDMAFYQALYHSGLKNNGLILRYIASQQDKMGSIDEIMREVRH